MVNLIEQCCQIIDCLPDPNCDVKGNPILENGVAIVAWKKGKILDTSVVPAVPIEFNHAQFNQTNALSVLRLAALNGDATFLPTGMFNWTHSAFSGVRASTVFGRSTLAPVTHSKGTIMLKPNETYGFEEYYRRWLCRFAKNIQAYNFILITASGHCLVIDNALMSATVMQAAFGLTNNIWNGTSLELDVQIKGDCTGGNYLKLSEGQAQIADKMPEFTIEVGTLTGGVAVVDNDCDCVTLHVPAAGGTAQFEVEESLVKCLSWTTTQCVGEAALPAGIIFDSVVTVAGTPPDNEAGILTFPALTAGDVHNFSVVVMKGCHRGILCIKAVIV